MAKKQGSWLPYREMGPGNRNVWAVRRPGKTWSDALWMAADSNSADKVALGMIRLAVENSALRKGMHDETARQILALLQIIDRVRPDALCEWERYACAAIYWLDMAGRALLYYDCCACLGYDPAEEAAPPVRL